METAPSSPPRTVTAVTAGTAGTARAARIAFVARIVALVAALVGLAASASLLAPYVVHKGLCSAAGCEEVAESVYGKWLGVPRAAIGVGAFVVAVVFAVGGGARVRRLAPVVGVVAALEAMRLIAVQAFVLHVFCPFCLVADGAAITLGVALVVEAIVARPSHASHASHPSQSREIERTPRFVVVGGVAAIAALFAPLVLASLRSGPHTQAIAKVQSVGGRLVIREFVDLECPFCRATHVALQNAIGDRKDIVVERHHVPYAQHKHAMSAAIAACCAGEQGAEDGFVDGVIRTDAPPSDDVCRMVASKLALDLGKWDACRASDRPREKIATDLALADKTGVEALPTIDVEGERVVGAMDESEARSLLARHGR